MSGVRRPRSQREAAQSVPVECQPDRQQDILSFLPEENQPLLATNTGVRLACTMAAMLSPFALFLCWAERESRVIRRFAVQSAALAILHLMGAGLYTYKEHHFTSIVESTAIKRADRELNARDISRVIKPSPKMPF